MRHGTSRALIALALTLVLGSSALAQQVVPPEAPPAVPAGAPHSTSLTVGYFNVDFEYASAENGYIYAFTGPALAFMLAGPLSSLSVAFGNEDGLPLAGDSLSFSPDRSMIDVALVTGGNINLLQVPGPAPVGVYVPIRLHLGYRFLNTSEKDVRGDAISSAHIPSATLGAGAGAWVRIPTGVPVLQDRLVGAAALTIGYGAMNEVVDGTFEVERTRVVRTTDFNLEAKLERLLNNKTGVSVGYTYRTAYWSDDYITDLVDSPSAPTRWANDLSDFSQRSRQHLLRVGLNW